MALRRYIPPLSILVFLALTLAGTYYARKVLLERAMVNAMELGDMDLVRDLAHRWPAPVNAEIPRDDSEYRGEFGGTTPLHVAVGANDEELVKLLLARGADTERRDEVMDRTPLLLAVINPKPRIMRLLLQHGADVNARDQNNATPLLRVFECLGRDNEPVSVLLDAGADVNGCNKDGWSILHRAALHGDERIVARLLSLGAKANVADRSGRTPLGFSATFFPDRSAAMKVLIDHGADVNAAETDGTTPLHDAAHFHNPEQVRWLIEAGADVNARDKKGQTPLQLARKAHQRSFLPQDSREKVIALLLKAGAKE